jgi:hypothetical protein
VLQRVSVCESDEAVFVEEAPVAVLRDVTRKQNEKSEGIALKWCKPYHHIEIPEFSQVFPVVSTSFSTSLCKT